MRQTLAAQFVVSDPTRVGEGSNAHDLVYNSPFQTPRVWGRGRHVPCSPSPGISDPTRVGEGNAQLSYNLDRFISDPTRVGEGQTLRSCRRGKVFQTPRVWGREQILCIQCSHYTTGWGVYAIVVCS